MNPDQEKKIDRVLAMQELFAARLEYLCEEVLKNHETTRRVPILEARLASLEAQFAAASEEDDGSGNGMIE